MPAQGQPRRDSTKVVHTVIRPLFRRAADYLTNPETPYSEEQYSDSIRRLVQPTILNHATPHVIQDIAAFAKRQQHRSVGKELADHLIAAIVISNPDPNTIHQVRIHYPMPDTALAEAISLTGDINGKLTPLRNRLFALKGKAVPRQPPALAPA